MKTKKAFYYLILAMSVSFCFTACSSDDESDKPVKEVVTDPSIIGAWELKTICYPEGDREIPSDNRDLFTFNSNGKVSVIIKKGKPLYPDLPNEDGEYEYSYDEGKQIIQLCGETLKCTISDGEMHMEGSHYGPDDGLYNHEFIFVSQSPCVMKAWPKGGQSLRLRRR